MRGKSLKREIDVSQMLHMREMGMSNKKIAESLDISVSTVYQWIGRRSEAVKHAEVQRKTCPIPNPMNFEEEPTEAVKPTKAIEPEMPVEAEKENDPVEVEEEAPMNDKQQLPETREETYHTNMPVLKKREIVDLKGSSCCFRVDTGDNTVEMLDDSSSLVKGLLDKESLGVFIRELMQVYRMLSENAS